MNKSLVEVVQRIGKVAFIRIGGFSFAVVVKDVKTAYGRFRYLVTPEHGEGTKWVDDDSLTF